MVGLSALGAQCKPVVHCNFSTGSGSSCKTLMPVLSQSMCKCGPVEAAASDAQVYLAEEVRARLLRQTNNPQLVQRLAPMQPGEAQAAQRARSLYTSLMRSMGHDTPPLLQVAVFICILLKTADCLGHFPGSGLHFPCCGTHHT